MTGLLQNFRIVSLVPSATLTVCDLGLRDAVVGCTNFCVKPKGIYKDATIVGGTKDPDLEKIKALKPTHILVNDEENRSVDIEACRQIATIVPSFPRVIDDSRQYVEELGVVFGLSDAAGAWNLRYQQALADLKALQTQHEFYAKRFLYLIWKNPYMAAARNTYVSEACHLLGMENVLPAQQNRYPELSIDDIQALGADVILFSSEPFPFRMRDIEEFFVSMSAAKRMPTAYKIDGQLCSWWGSMTVELMEQVAHALRGEESALIKRVENA